MNSVTADAAPRGMEEGTDLSAPKQRVERSQRFTAARPCPICGGHLKVPPGRNRRCWGFLSRDGGYVFCTREEHAGALAAHEAGSFMHSLAGSCGCGASHAAPHPRVEEPNPNCAPFRIAAEYSDADEGGHLVCQVVRLEPKSFKYRRPDEEGRWTWSMGDVSTLLYRLPEVLAADPAEPVFIVEGKKDVDDLRGLGLIATTNPFGAGKWHDRYSSVLKGRNVVVLSDNDAPGRDHAQMVAHSVIAVANTVKVLELPGLPEKGDVSDWIAAGGTAQQLVSLAAAAPSWSTSSQDVTTWPRPDSLPGGLLPVPAFPLDILPSALRDWLVDIAERVQCPLEYAAITAVVALGAVIGRKCAIRPQRPDGTEAPRVRKVSPIQTRQGAEEYERQLPKALLDGTYGRKEVPTFAEWYNGDYWQQWVIGRKNKPSTIESKRSTYRNYLEEAFGHLRLDEIRVAEIARFRASLVAKGLGDKTVNNILADLSKPLHYAADVEPIPKAPKIGLFPIEQPEILFWEFEEYARLLAAARRVGQTEYTATCLAGEAGLRVGEIKALRWREDVDLIARTLTINQQMRRGALGTPKGRTRRTVPMTETLFDALRTLDQVREGLVIRNLAGEAKHDENQVKNLAYRICRLAGLPERGWHPLRHTFATHAALFGVNLWSLQRWLGHKRIEETMRYVHTAEAHARPTPERVVQADGNEHDLDRRILKMLGARRLLVAGHTEGTWTVLEGGRQTS